MAHSPSPERRIAPPLTHADLVILQVIEELNRARELGLVTGAWPVRCEETDLGADNLARLRSMPPPPQALRLAALDALFAMQGNYKRPPSDVVQALLELLQHVREEHMNNEAAQ